MRQLPAACALRYTEIVGLLPQARALIEAGRHYLHMQQRSTGIPDSEIIKIAVKSMGLDDLKPFDPAEKVIEYMLESKSGDGGVRLTAMSCRGFAEETASESPLRVEVPWQPIWVLSVRHWARWWPTCRHKSGWDERWKEFSDAADAGQALMPAPAVAGG